MKYETRIFNNFESNETEKKRSKNKFYEDNERLFQIYMPKILKTWSEYLMDYANRTSEIFGASEYPWIKFDEATWVSSLAVAIARKYKDAILVEELPVTKVSSFVEESNEPKGKKTNLGNADLWCCLNSTDKDDRFSFYLEAKFTPGARRKLEKHKNDQNAQSIKPITLEEVRNQIAKSTNRNSLLSRVFRDYQKSAGKKGTQKYYTTLSPHIDEPKRKHDHAFLALLIKPVFWDQESWSKHINFSDIFADKIVNVSYRQGHLENPTRKNIYNLPSTGIIMRNEDGYGFVALVLMLGEAKYDDVTN